MITNKNTLKITTILTICLLGVNTGCTFHKTGGRDFNTNNVSKIRIGKTTKSEVSKYLGSPEATRGEINGSEMWFYSFRTQKKTSYPAPHFINKHVRSIDKTEKSVRVTFEKNGVVNECIYHTETVAQSTGQNLSNRIRCQDVK